MVPYTRGEEVSRPLDGIIREVAGLAERGVREVTLLGQNVNAWRDSMHDGQPADFALLLRYVAAIDDIERVRYTTSHPREFTDSLIQVHAEVEELAAHVPPAGPEWLGPGAGRDETRLHGPGIQIHHP